MGGDGGDGRDLRLWFRDEIESGLAGVFVAMACASGAESPDYRRGFADALRSVALVFGVEKLGKVNIGANVTVDDG